MTQRRGSRALEVGNIENRPLKVIFLFSLTTLQSLRLPHISPRKWQHEKVKLVTPIMN